jgi:hypothetical protein
VASTAPTTWINIVRDDADGGGYHGVTKELC